MRLRVAIILLAILAFGFVKACAQGLTLRDVAFVAAGSAGGGTTGGSGAPTAPTEYWDMQEASGARISEVTGKHMTPEFTIGTDTDLHGNAASWADSGDLTANMDTYAEGGALSINYWAKGSPMLFFYTNSGNDYITGTPDSVNFMTEVQTGYTVSINRRFGGSDSVDASSWTGGTTWSMFTIVYSSGIVTLYIDGVSKGSTSTPIDINGDAAPQFGWDGSAPVVTSRVDETAIWYDYALTADDITWLYNGGSGRVYSDF